jgi:hypothetical protein
MYSEGHWHVFSTVQHNKVCDIIEDFPAGETASSSEELEALFETAADEKLTEFHRIQNTIEARGAPKRKERGARPWNPTGAGSPLPPPGGLEPPLLHRPRAAAPSSTVETGRHRVTRRLPAR